MPCFGVIIRGPSFLKQKWGGVDGGREEKWVGRGWKESWGNSGQAKIYKRRNKCFKKKSNLNAMVNFDIKHTILNIKPRTAHSFSLFIVISLLKIPSEITWNYLNIYYWLCKIIKFNEYIIQFFIKKVTLKFVTSFWQFLAIGLRILFTESPGKICKHGKNSRGQKSSLSFHNTQSNVDVNCFWWSDTVWSGKGIPHFIHIATFFLHKCDWCACKTS